eukprot:jgi/Tetstr1/449242/TSEL_036447.t1
MNAIDTAKGRETLQQLTPDEPAKNWGEYLSDHVIDWNVAANVSAEQAAARLDAITKFRAKLGAMKSADCLTPIPVREHIAATNTSIKRVAAAVGNGPPAPVSDDGGSKVDDVMGVGEDPVGEDGSGKVTVQSGWVMEDCLHHMETFSILNAGPLLEEARNVVTEEDGPERKAQVDALTREGRTQYPARRQGARPGQRGAKARRPGQRGAKARRPGQRGAKARRPGQRGAKTAAAGAARRQGAAAGAARRQGAAAGAARRQGAAAGAARRQGAAAGQRGAKARRPGQRGAKARRPGQRALAGAARRQGAAAGAARRQDSAYSGIGGKGCITSCGRQPLKTMRSCRNNPSTGFWIPLIWLTAAGCGMQGRMTEVAVLVSPQSLHAAEAAQPHRH